jgi:hypothetical protein
MRISPVICRQTNYIKSVELIDFTQPQINSISQLLVDNPYYSKPVYNIGKYSLVPKAQYIKDTQALLIELRRILTVADITLTPKP